MRNFSGTSPLCSFHGLSGSIDRIIFQQYSSRPLSTLPLKHQEDCAFSISSFIEGTSSIGAQLA